MNLRQLLIVSMLLCGVNLSTMDMDRVRDRIAEGIEAEADLGESHERAVLACVMMAAPYLADVEFKRVGAQGANLFYPDYAQVTNRWCVAPGGNCMVNCAIWRCGTAPEIVVVLRAFDLHSLFFSGSDAATAHARLLATGEICYSVAAEPKITLLKAHTETSPQGKIIRCAFRFQGYPAVSMPLSPCFGFAETAAPAIDRLPLVRAVNAINEQQSSGERAAVMCFQSIVAGCHLGDAHIAAALAVCPLDRREAVAAYFTADR